MPLWYLTVSTLQLIITAVAVMFAVTALADVIDLRRDRAADYREMTKMHRQLQDLRKLRSSPMAEERRAAVRWSELKEA